jgi:hypothetical protein
MPWLHPVFSALLAVAAAGSGGGTQETRPAQTGAVAATAASSAVEPAPAPAELYLALPDIRKIVAASEPEIARCYKDHGLVQPRATGTLSVQLLIHRNGTLKSLEVDAPGVKGDALRSCIDRVASSWRFPQRRRFTRVALPFLFLRTQAPGAGPQLSCWDPKGCPKKTHRR